MQGILESIVYRDVPENINLWPGIESRLKQKDVLSMKSPNKLSTSLVIAFVALLLVSTAAYAYYRFIGSDPGLEGVNEQNLIIDINVTAFPIVYSTPPIGHPHLEIGRGRRSPSSDRHRGRGDAGCKGDGQLDLCR